MKEVDNVRVVVRTRPLNEKEVSTNCNEVVKVCNSYFSSTHVLKFYSIPFFFN